MRNRHKRLNDGQPGPTRAQVSTIVKPVQFGLKGGGANTHFTSVTGNFVYKVPSMGVMPYLIGGAGWYNVGGSGGGGSENDFGWNAGGGVSMPLSGFDTFIEARYNRVSRSGTASAFIPITFGIMF